MSKLGTFWLKFYNYPEIISEYDVYIPLPAPVIEPKKDENSMSDEQAYDFLTLEQIARKLLEKI